MSNMYSCIIIDDEPNTIGLLSATLSELFPNITVQQTCTRWTEALEALRTTPFDIVFIDISIPGKNGIDVLKLVPSIKSEIIFITAHPDYAIEAFKVAATGYVLKPFDDVELAGAINTAIERIDAKRMARVAAVPEKPEIIGIPDNKGISYIDKSEIAYLEATNKCTIVVTTTKEICSSYNLGKFKTVLDNKFCQIHRSYIVNLAHVKRYLSVGSVIMSNNVELPISKNYREDFLKLVATVSKSAEG